MSGASTGKSRVAEWRSVRRLFPIYASLAERFDLPKPPYKNLDDVPKRSELEVVEQVKGWLDAIDSEVKPHQLRQMLQSAGISQADEKLRALARRYLTKVEHNDLDRDKLDFLMTQYLFVCAPPSFAVQDTTLEDIAEVLEPVLGECPTLVPSWLEPLEQLVEQIKRCGSLQQLASAQIVEQGRDIKASAGERYFGATALLTFTFFNYYLRQAFAKSSAAAIAEIEQRLTALEKSGVSEIDGSEAGLGRRQSVASLRGILQKLTQDSAPEYTTDDDAVRRLIALSRAAESGQEVKTSFTPTDEERIGKLELAIAELKEQFVAMQFEIRHLQEAATNTAADNSLAGLNARNSAVAQQPENPFAIIRDVNLRADFESATEHLRKALITQPSAGSTGIKIGGSTLALSEDEVRLLNAEDELLNETSRLVVRGLAARTLLTEQIEIAKHSTAVDFGPFLLVAGNFLQDMRRAGGRHGIDHDAIATGARMLATVIRQAEVAAQKSN